MELRDVYKLALDSIRQQQVNLSRMETEINLLFREVDKTTEPVQVHKPVGRGQKVADAATIPGVKDRRRPTFRKLSNDARRRMSSAQKKRWAAFRAAAAKNGGKRG